MVQLQSSEEIATYYDVFADFTEVINSLYGDNDVRMYTELKNELGSGQSSVELGIGYGRIAQAVGPTYGVDLSEAMLAKCRKRLANDCPMLIQEDFRTYKLPQPAYFTYLPQSTINQIPAADRRTVFNNVFQNTESGGSFIVDSVIPNVNEYKHRSTHPCLIGHKGSWVIFETVTVQDLENQILTVQYYGDQLDDNYKVKSRHYSPSAPHYYLFPEQIEQLATETNWIIEYVWGTFSRDPLAPNSAFQIWSFRKP